MKLRVKKLPILLPLVVLAVVLATAAVTVHLGRDSASAHTNLGRKYLNDMNYTGAIAEFLQSLSMDPTIQDARLGLAEAYIASGSPEMAPEILEPLTEAEAPAAYRLLIESQRETDPRQALLTAQKLVEHTDREEDYSLRDVLLGQTLAEAHSYAQGLDHRLALIGGEVFSAGSNTLGQLGTGQLLGTDQVQDSLRSAEFPGQARRVYCVGRTSYVVDQDDVLWAAGENRWGQFGVNYVSADPESGWSRITDNVASAAGSVGVLYILKTDGSLWYAGQGGMLALRQITDFGMVTAIGSRDRQTAMLTVNGTLYLSDTSDPLRWTRQAGHVKAFCFGGSGLTWATDENRLCSQYGIQAPNTWLWDGEGVTPDFAVRELAADANGLLLLDTSGLLLRLYNGQLYESDGSAVSGLYSTGGPVAVEQEDGTVALWDLSRPAPELVG